MKIVATIEARMKSSRLPGKVLLQAACKPMLKHLVERLQQVKQIDDIVIATTVNEADLPLVDFAKSNNINVYRGSEEDVMQRVIDAATSVKADLIVEITGDCPIIDPQIVEQVIQLYQINQCDYASNAHVRSFPDGMDVQVFTLETLKKSAALTSDILEHEHVTLHIRKNPQIFKQVHLPAPANLRWPELGVTLDERNDYELIKRIIEHFGKQNPYFSCTEIVNLLRANPEWLAINQDVKRKGDT